MGGRARLDPAVARRRARHYAGERRPLLQWATPPNLAMAFEIEDLTEGAVPARYWPRSRRTRRTDAVTGVGERTSPSPSAVSPSAWWNERGSAIPGAPARPDAPAGRPHATAIALQAISVRVLTACHRCAVGARIAASRASAGERRHIKWTCARGDGVLQLAAATSGTIFNRVHPGNRRWWVRIRGPGRCSMLRRAASITRRDRSRASQR
jgi:hypothetical protein